MTAAGDRAMDEQYLRAGLARLPALTYNELTVLYDLLDTECGEHVGPTPGQAPAAASATKDWSTLNALRTAVGEARSSVRPVIDERLRVAEEALVAVQKMLEDGHPTQEDWHRIVSGEVAPLRDRLVAIIAGDVEAGDRGPG